MRLIGLLLLLACCAPQLRAEDSFRALHDGETATYREARVGEWAATNVLAWSPRYFNLTENRGFNDSFTTRYLTGVEFMSLRYWRMHDYRVDEDTTLRLTPTLSLGWGAYEHSSNDLFELENLGFGIERPVHYFGHHVSADIGLRFGYRSGNWEPYADWHSLFAWRFQEVRTSDTIYTTPSGGFIDRVDEPIRDVTDAAELHSWGAGIAYWFGNDPWQYSVFSSIKPFNQASFKGRSVTIHGFDIGMGAYSLRLSDDSALYLGFRWEYWFSNDEFSTNTTFEFSIGVRFS